MRNSLLCADIIKMIAHGHKDIEEQLSPAVEHFKLHGAASLEG